MAAAKKPRRKPLKQPEMVRILEGIARTGTDGSRIQAIKTLREINGDEETDQGEGFDALDEVGARRNRKAS